MNNSESRALKTLEWERILQSLGKHAFSAIGKARCLSAKIHTEIKDIQYQLNLTAEAFDILGVSAPPSLNNIRDIEEALNLAKAGITLKSSELIDIAYTLQTSRLIKGFLNKYSTEIPLLAQLGERLFDSRELEESILSIFDEAGTMLDSASPELRTLRKRFKDQTANLKNRMSGLMQSQDILKLLQEPVYTIRNERYVLPVRAEFKSSVPGIIHDTSSSGATLFIEPQAIVALNNDIKETELAIENEIKRILSELTAKVREYVQPVRTALETLAEIDFIFARARYSHKLKAVKPRLNREKYILLKAARHPILTETIENVVPNDIEIGKSWNTLIITGSNTGGKTVALKTAGLCNLMTRAGLYIPADEADIYPFKKIFADIGDEQSIVQSLSTFSAHMTNIINVVKNADSESFILLDEIGSGTDPQEGAALATAILLHLYNKGARTIVTTHLGELKTLAFKQEGVQNASVEFNTETLAPTYHLIIGIPGKSNAITIAQNLGLSKEVIKQAQEIYSTQKDDTVEIIESIQNTQQELSKNARIIENTKEELELLEKDYSEKIDRIRSEKKQTLKIYKKKFDTELTEARDEIKSILNEVRRTKSEKIARRAYSRLGQIEEKLGNLSYSEQESLQPQYAPIDWEKIKPGDTVYVKHMSQNGTLLTMPDKNGNVQIEIGFLKSTVKVDKLAGAEKKSSSTKYEPPKQFRQFVTKSVEAKLDLRGARVEDALIKIEHYLDEASLAGLPFVYIIHGHGTGALRDSIRDYLKTSPYVINFRPGEKGEGENGVTVVEVK